MDVEDLTVRTIEPGKDDEVVAGAKPLQALEHGRFEGEPGVRRPLVALFRGRRGILQRGFDASDRRYLEVGLVDVSPPVLRRQRGQWRA